VKLARLTAAKAVANTALRWVPPFLPTLERAFGASTSQMTTILGVGEMAGLSTVAVGKFLDRGRERLVMSLALVVISISSLVALVGTTLTFAIAFLLVVLGVANLTVAGHSTIGRSVPYAGRARAIGLYETSWAFALLIGAPVIALLIKFFGWRGPYVVLAIACAAMAAWIWTSGARNAVIEPVESKDRMSIRSLPLRAWAVIVGSALLAMSGLSVFAISGKWLDTAFGVSTGGLGLVAMGFGAFELLASTGSAGFADRIGKLRATMLGIAVLFVGQLVMVAADDTLWIGVVGILVFLCGFEFAFVTSLSLVTEAMPESRGTTIALANGVGTVARGSGTIASGFLFTRWGIEGTLSMSAIAAVVATSCFVLSRPGRVSARRSR
jgi:DHA1 family inner membrane transport protein